MSDHALSNGEFSGTANPGSKALKTFFGWCFSPSSSSAPLF